MKSIVIRDDEGVTHRLDRAPRRIVSLVPSLTESVATLGGADRLVGVTDWCVHPADVVKSIPRIRGTKNPYVKGILELRPDLVLANREENRERHVAELRRHVPVFVTYPRSVFDALKTIRDLGVILEVRDRALDIVGMCEFLIQEAHKRVDPYFHTACLIWRDPWMAVGPDTYIHDLLGHFGWVNVYREDDGRYPETSLEALSDRCPEVVLLPSEPYAFGERDREEVQAAVWKKIPECRVVLVEGSYLTWWGARTLSALRYLGQLKADLVEPTS
jgi:ABC-type Fe3+-hydroxamate transport system substrate-binding protein